MDEFEVIRRIFASHVRPSPSVVLGIGDDAAVLRVPAGHELVATTDTLVAEVHFPRDMDPEALGHRALAVNLSDLAAMGAEPAWVLLALTLSETDAVWLEKFARGFFALAERFQVALVGGNLSRGPLNITITAQGWVPEGGAITRAGARAGDRLYMTGELGAAAAGLQLWQQQGLRDPRDVLLHRFLRPEPRLWMGAALRGIATAMIDISDGLLADIGHILDQSGAGANLDLEALPLVTAATEKFGLEHARLLALTGGDDYELCFTVPEAQVPRMEQVAAAAACRVTCIGAIEAIPGMRGHDAQGRPQALPARRGYRHF